MRKLAALLLGSSLLALAAEAPAIAQEPTGLMGYVVAVDPLPGHGSQFEEGAKRHMEWYADAGGSWSWAVFEIIMGERTGQYVFGSFNHAYADFDTSDVDPQGSAASIDRNVAPHTENVVASMVRFRDDLSMAEPGQPLRPIYEVLSFEVKPGHNEDFEHFWVKFREAIQASGMPAEYFVYQYAQGGKGGTWVISIPHESFAEMEGPEGWMEDMFEQAYGKFEGRALMEMVGEIMTSFTSEIFAYRADMSVNVPM